MEREEFVFSRLQPILSVLYLLTAFYFFSNKNTLFLLAHNWLAICFVILGLIYMVKNLRVSYLLLRKKPALILTNEKIVVTAKGDNIFWIDVKDVYMTSRSFGMVNPVKFTYVTICVREPEKYLKSIKNPFVRNYRWYTRNWKVSPFEISLFFVGGDDDEIYHEVLRYYQNNRGF